MSRSAVAFFAPLAIAALACGDPTIRVVIDSDLSFSTVYPEGSPDGARFDAFRIRVQRDSDTKYDESFASGLQGLPASLILEQDDSADERDVVVIVEATGTDINNNKQVIVSRTANLDFSTNDVVLPLPLCEACAGIMCNDGFQTCVGGTCVDAKVDEEALAEDDEQVPELNCGTGGGGGTGGGTPTCNGVCGSSEQCGTCPSQDISRFSFYLLSCEGGRCIDSYEVTRDMYAAFLETNPLPPDGCTVQPDATCMEGSLVCQDSGCERHPQVCVDHCAAAAFCSWHQMRLCGDAEWETACRGSGGTEYPYGDMFDQALCNGNNNMTSTLPADQNSTCAGGQMFLYNMSGNVAEWVADSTSIVRGGHFLEPPINLTCTAKPPASGPADTIGFRCCKDDI